MCYVRQLEGNLILRFSCLLDRVNLDTIFFDELNPLSETGVNFYESQIPVS